MYRDADMLSLLLARQPKHTLPGALYHDADLFQVDMRQIVDRRGMLTP